MKRSYRKRSCREPDTLRRRAACKQAHSWLTLAWHMTGVSLEAQGLIRAVSHCMLRLPCLSFRLEKQVVNQLVTLQSSGALGLRAPLPAAAAAVAASGGTPYLAPPPCSPPPSDSADQFRLIQQPSRHLNNRCVEKPIYTGTFFPFISFSWR